MPPTLILGVAEAEMHYSVHYCLSLPLKCTKALYYYELGSFPAKGGRMIAKYLFQPRLAIAFDLVPLRARG